MKQDVHIDMKRAYLVGIGGIGMSALARYFLMLGWRVAGYDRTKTVLTKRLEEEGCTIHYSEDPGLIPGEFRNPSGTVVIHTPAVPSEHRGLSWFRKNDFTVLKRSEMLERITEGHKTVAVAGTHGKTTVTSILAHILHHSGTGCNAFAGGIMKNYGSNVLFSDPGDLYVVEADEFDRSFLRLHPAAAVITSCDPDHLDVYRDRRGVEDAFAEFAFAVRPDGWLLRHGSLTIGLHLQEGVGAYTYSATGKADFMVRNPRYEAAASGFDLVFPGGETEKVRLGIPGEVNVENALAGAAAASLLGVRPGAIADALAGYRGVRRRFDLRAEGGRFIYIDDYAHHPKEIEAFIASVRKAYPGRKLTGIFQPHLYSRTRDLAAEFALSLDGLDELLMLDIYPAREEPVPGVSSGMILDKMKLADKRLCRKDEITGILSGGSYEVLVTMGAGDIDALAGPISRLAGKEARNE